MRLALLLAAGTLVAQEQPLVRINTRMVEVDVVVKDKNGPVANLTQDDFTVFDEGKRQKIAAFSVRQGQRGQSEAGNVLPVLPGGVSNQVRSSSTSVLMFDALNTPALVPGSRPIAPQSIMRLEALKYLQTAQPGDQYAVYTLADSLKVIEDFTDDVPRVIRAVERFRPENSKDQRAENMMSE